jgi:hypothetical protein
MAAVVLALPADKAYTKLPALFRSISPAAPLADRSSCEMMWASPKLISTTRLTTGSVTYAECVASDTVAQHVARWPSIFWTCAGAACPLRLKDRMVAPKEASVTKSEFALFGIGVTPNRTAVPEGWCGMSVNVSHAVYTFDHAPFGELRVPRIDSVETPP